jgi:hypothetical protein
MQAEKEEQNKQDLREKTRGLGAEVAKAKRRNNCVTFGCAPGMGVKASSTLAENY